MICTILVILSLLDLNAQNTSATPTVGIKIGPLLSTVIEDEAIDKFAKKMGIQIGLTGAVYVHPKLSLRAELNYEVKGGQFINHDMVMNLNYITFPFYLKFNFTKEPEFYVYQGFYFSYLINAKTKGVYEISLGDDHIYEEINENITPNLNPIDWGLLIGVGAQGRFNRWLDVFIDLRYTRGYENLDNKSSKYRYNFNFNEFWPRQNLRKPKNKTYMLTVGIIYYFDPR
ncbi:MAG: PorT family protein [Bacteroidales bacterium]|nr:PorT family protein [Bacteroidales bacterium]